MTLAVGDDKAKDLAAKLLSKIAQYLPHERGQAGKAFMLSEFIDQVYQRGDALHPEEATVRARTVLQTIEEAVTEGGIRRSRLTTAAGVRPATRRGGASRIGSARSRRVIGRAKLSVSLPKARSLLFRL